MAHKIIENAIPVALCRAAEAAWPDMSWPYWHRYDCATANKFGTMDRQRIPPACLAAIDALAAAVASHIGDSFIDYDLHAAGLHMMPPGGFLGRHLDAEFHPIRPWRRTHSVVMGINSSWGELCGGQLVLDPDTEIDVNPCRAIVLETPGQWHSVRRVNTDVSLLCRKTIALFAWQVDHSTTGSTSARFREAAECDAS